MHVTCKQQNIGTGGHTNQAGQGTGLKETSRPEEPGRRPGREAFWAVQLHIRRTKKIGVRSLG